MTETENHLSLLGVFYIVLGLLGCLSSLVPAFLIVFGMGLFFSSSPPGEEEPLAYLFGAICLMIIVIGEALSVCMIVAGTRLRSHRSYTFCQVVACAICFCPPFGTVLGALTLIVLTKPEAKRLFGVEVPA
jgi:hypothetical protein